jgi:predicted nucleic acid-binding protein
MELIQGCRDHEEVARVKTFVSENMGAMIFPEESIGRSAIRLLEEHAVSHGLRLVDALLAATALENAAELATANMRHYRRIGGLRLIPFKPGR